MDNNEYSFDTKTILQRLEYLISRTTEATGKSKAQQFKEADVNRNIMTNLKKGSYPTIDKIVKLAIYYRVPIEFIVGMPETISTNKNDLDSELDSILDSIPEEKKSQVIDYAKYLLTRPEIEE